GFSAFDARTGNQLWSFPAPAGVIGVPTSFEVDGQQYIAVTTGWDLDARGVQNGVDAINKTTTVVPQAETVLVFKLQCPRVGAGPIRPRRRRPRLAISRGHNDGDNFAPR